MAEVRVERLSKVYGSLKAVDGLDFLFEEGKVTCLLGPSGCGKTTLLRMLGGLEDPTSGRIFLDGHDVTNHPPKERRIGMVFQYPVVYKGLTVYHDIELPLLRMKLDAAEKEKRISRAMDILGLSGSADVQSSELDSVMRQKVAVARAIASQPRILLFDEPMTNIDAGSRLQFKHSFKELTRSLSQTIVYVTHDQTEAMTLADRIALMKDGRIIQCDTPRNIYNVPETEFGGWFLGSPGMNFMNMKTVNHNGGKRLLHPAFSAPVVLGEGCDFDEIKAGIRPEYVNIAAGERQGWQKYPVKRKYLTIGGSFIVEFAIDGVPLKCKVANETGKTIGDYAYFSLPRDKIQIFTPAGENIGVERRVQ
jgi:ABC-type sugar transport system ATPase subunit